MEFKYQSDPIRFRTMTTKEIRESFLVDNLFQPDEIKLIYSYTDRAILGSIVPVEKKLNLNSEAKFIATDYFTGGIKIFEFTMTTSGALDIIKKVAKEIPDDYPTGSGSVLDMETARIAILSGAQFIVGLF